MSNASATWALHRNCDEKLPALVCVLGNVCGLGSAALWFIVLLPQLVRSWRQRSVEGLSVGWALLNFTAALNNTFFVFRVGAMPLYAHISAVYMPVLEAVLLVFFWTFTPHSAAKTVTAVISLLVWSAIVAAQVCFDIYTTMEWLSITLWSIETFPQVFLNMRRGTTKGYSNEMALIATIGKTTDFCATYMLVLPLQYVVMAFFSSTTALVVSVQILWYWRSKPAGETDADGLVSVDVSPACNVLRGLAAFVLCAELSVFCAAIVWRTQTPWFAAAPAATYATIGVAWLYYSHMRARQ